MQKKLKICLLLPTFFSQNFPSRPAITEIYGEYLPKMGHKVIWVTPTYKKINKTEKFKKITIYQIYFANKSIFPLKLFEFFKYYLRKYKLLNNLLRDNKFEILQVRNDIFDALLAIFFKKKYNIPFVFQYSFPKNVYKYKNSKSLYEYFFGKFENYALNYILKNSDFIFPISDRMMEEISSKGINNSKMESLPMGVNSDLFRIKNSDIIKDTYNLKDFKVFLYIGTLDKLRNLSVLIKSFHEVQNHFKNTKLLIVGDGNDKYNLEKLAISYNIDDKVIFTGKVPYFDIPTYISASDICICPVPPLKIFEVSSPTKLFEYMAVNKPIIANDEIPEHKNVLKKSGAGILVKFDSYSFAWGMMVLLKDPEKAFNMGHKGREWVKKNRSYSNMAIDVEKVYLKLISD